MGLPYKVSLVFNFWETENVLFRILLNQGSSGAQIGWGFLQRYYFIMRSIWRSSRKREEPRGPKEPRWHDQLTRLCHQGSFGPHASPRHHIFTDAFVSQKRDALFFPLEPRWCTGMFEAWEAGKRSGTRHSRWRDELRFDGRRQPGCCPTPVWRLPRWLDLARRRVTARRPRQGGAGKDRGIAGSVGERPIERRHRQP
jgi:hypothetical protein